jgi:hypothetical protein
MTSIRLAGEAIENLDKRTREDAERQKESRHFTMGNQRGIQRGNPRGNQRGNPRGNLRGVIGKNLNRNFMSLVSWQK